LVTGGAGFIGSTTCRRLVSDGNSVVNVDKLTYAANLGSLVPIAQHPQYTFERADICDRPTVSQIFAQYQPDAVLHLAAESHVDRSITDAGAFIQTNFVGTYQLLEAARQYWTALPSSRRTRFRFIHVSTDEVFGSLSSEGRFREDTPYQPSSPYSASKAGADHLAQAWHKTYGLPVILCNCSNNYGPYQFPEKLIPLSILNASDIMPLTVYGDGSHIRDWLYVEDFADGLVRLLSRAQPGDRYNFRGGGEYTNLEVAKLICAILDRTVPSTQPRDSLITFVADRPGHDLRYAVDATKACAELDWRPRVDFPTGLEQTVRWYLQNRPWWESLRQKVYGGERLGLLDGNSAPR
jgi:dTDP-glucose 4,6-dehydratase